METKRGSYFGMIQNFSNRWSVLQKILSEAGNVESAREMLTEYYLGKPFNLLGRKDGEAKTLIEKIIKEDLLWVNEYYEDSSLGFDGLRAKIEESFGIIKTESNLLSAEDAPPNTTASTTTEENSHNKKIFTFLMAQIVIKYLELSEELPTDEQLIKRIRRIEPNIGSGTVLSFISYLRRDFKEYLYNNEEDIPF